MTIYQTEFRDRAEVLRFLAGLPGLSLTAPELAKALGVDERAVVGHLAALCAAEIVYPSEGLKGWYYLPENLEGEVRALFAKLMDETPCRLCGCTDSWGCDEGCWWVEPDLCSSCAASGDDAS